MKMKYIKKLIPIFALLMLLGGCGAAETTAEETTASSGIIQPGAKKSTPEVEYVIKKKDVFSNRDFDASYTGQTDIDLGKESGDVTLSGGVWRVYGKLKGSIIIDAGNEKVQLVLAGAEIQAESAPAIYIKSADKVFITLEKDYSSSLSVTGSGFSGDADGCIYSKADLTINGEGILEISSPAIGINCRDDMIITGGNIRIDSDGKGIVGKDCVGIGGGTLNIASGSTGIYSSNDTDAGRGYIYILDGDIFIDAGGDGLIAENFAAVCGGNISVINSYEALEAKNVYVYSGNLWLNAKDDGINASVGKSCTVDIYDGNIFINAYGDGIDSDGEITVNGGCIYISGPVIEAESAIDFGTAGYVNGGTVIAAGWDGMMMNPDSGTQYSGLFVYDEVQSAGSVISVYDAGGSKLAEFEAEKEFKSVVVSAEGFDEGGRVTVTAG